MRYMEDPTQNELFDFFKEILSPAAYRRLTTGWQHLFRQAILRLMPADKLAEHFDPSMGRPTKELYSMAALVLIMEFRDWTQDEAVDAYMFNVDLQYALNLRPEGQSLCRRTLCRYLELFREDNLAQKIMNDVTCELVRLLDLDISKQRLDSTHIESNMAKFGRTRLMGVAIKNFLTQVKRHDEKSYLKLREEIRERYEPSRNQMFGDWSRESDWSRLRQTVAEDMHYLVERYAKNRKHCERSTYKTLVTVFEQQCEVSVEKETVSVTVRKSPGSNIMVNPSDPDATLDGHKGSGYQVQLVETCSENNEVQVITYAEPQKASEHDSKAMNNVLVGLEETELMPEEMLADTAYGNDHNHQMCERDEIDLVSPTSGRDKDAVVDEEKHSAGDFVIEIQDRKNHYGQVVPTPVCTACPAGRKPHRSHYKPGADQLDILQWPEVCASCPSLSKCPQRHADGWSIVTIKMKDVRLEQRRAYEKTDEFRDRYRPRSGIEATNSILKRVTGLGRLRVRGRRSVFTSILLKVVGWNILRAAQVRELLAKLAQGTEDGQTSELLRRISWLLSLLIRFQGQILRIRRVVA